MIAPVDTIKNSEDEVVGKVLVQVELFSSGDEGMVERGQLKAEQIRTSKIEALVDTGATLMSLPQEELDKVGCSSFQRTNEPFRKRPDRHQENLRSHPHSCHGSGRTGRRHGVPSRNAVASWTNSARKS